MRRKAKQQYKRLKPSKTVCLKQGLQPLAGGFML